jgi:acetyl-CoA acetyltransferase
MKAVISAYARSPFHFARKGKLAEVRPDDLGAQVVKGLMQRTGVDPACWTTSFSAAPTPSPRRATTWRASSRCWRASRMKSAP